MSRMVAEFICKQFFAARLSWLMFMLGAVIGGRAGFAASDEHDEFDGDMAARVLRLMAITDGQLMSSGGAQSPSAVHMEHAYLWLLDQTRKIYISDQVQRTSHVSYSMHKNNCVAVLHEVGRRGRCRRRDGAVGRVRAQDVSGVITLGSSSAGGMCCRAGRRRW